MTARVDATYEIMPAFAAFGASSSCPDCLTQVEARASIARDEPVKWTLVAGVPFVIVVALAIASYGIGRRPPWA